MKGKLGLHLYSLYLCRCNEDKNFLRLYGSKRHPKGMSSGASTRKILRAHGGGGFLIEMRQGKFKNVTI